MISLRIYSEYFSRFLKARLSYRWDFLFSIVSAALVTGSGIVFVLFLLDGQVIKGLQGWSRDHVLFIYGYAQLSTALFSILSPNLYEFGDKYVIQGQFDRILLRPLGTLGQVIFESFELEALGSFCVGLGVIIYAKGNLGIEFNLPDYLWILVSSISGAAILLSVFVTLASMSFHFEDRLGITAPFYNMITFGRYPLPIFNDVLQFILRWIIPFAFVGFYPATHFFNDAEFAFYCYLTPFMAIICMMVAVLVWNYGVSRYSSTGS